MRVFPRRLAAAIWLTCIAGSAQAGLFADGEGGVASNGYNDVRIPGDSGTDISLSEELDAERTEYLRVRLGMNLGQRHKLSILVAPLRLEARGAVNRDVEFNGVRFTAGESLRSRYRFDSYRLTYSYLLVDSDGLRFDLGLTAKIRDASIRIEGGGESSEKTNTGFVPLVNFSVDWSFASQFGVLFQGDALAAPQGRAEDVLLALYVDADDSVRLRLGYRVLEGGADNDEVYNFTLVHFFSAGVTVSL